MGTKPIVKVFSPLPKVSAWAEGTVSGQDAESARIKKSDFVFMVGFMGGIFLRGLQA
jgi:hypothetical protein